MSNLRHSLPGILFAIFIVLIGLYGIFISTDFTHHKNSAERIKYSIRYEDYEDNDSTDVKHLPPIDTLPFVVRKQNEKKESNVPIIGKILKMLSDGISKSYPSHKDSIKTDSIK